MKCLILFSWENNINLSSAELAQRVVKIKALSKNLADDILKFILSCFFFQRK